MKQVFMLILFISVTTFAQENYINNSPFHSNQNIKKFADYLFCERDYLRAYFEYEKILDESVNDTVEFKSALSLSRIGNYTEAVEKFNEIKISSIFFSEARKEYYKNLFLTGNYDSFRNSYRDSPYLKMDEINKLFYYSFFYSDDVLPLKEEYGAMFPENEQNKIFNFYERKIDPPYKSGLAAGLLSALIPGSGKIYVGEYSDGITAFLSTVLLGYLSYTNFNADHQFRGWLFAGLTSLFYAGNIYGSVAAAQIYNAGVRYNFKIDLDLFLEQENYFMKDYGFCK